MILHELLWDKKRCIVHKEQYKGHIICSSVSLGSILEDVCLFFRALNFCNSLLLGIVGTNYSCNFNVCDTMGELHDLGGPCQCCMLKRT